MKIDVDPMDRLVLDINDLKVSLHHLLKWLDDMEARVTRLENNTPPLHPQ